MVSNQQLLLYLKDKPLGDIKNLPADLSPVQAAEVRGLLTHFFLSFGLALGGVPQCVIDDAVAMVREAATKTP
jgi:hypothetical protein